MTTSLLVRTARDNQLACPLMTTILLVRPSLEPEFSPGEPLTKSIVLSSSSSIYWHSNLVTSADWLRMLAHVQTLTYAHISVLRMQKDELHDS